LQLLLSRMVKKSLRLNPLVEFIVDYFKKGNF